MVGINFDPEDAIEPVYRRFQDGTYSLDEEGISFLLGYHLTRNHVPTVGFELGVFGPMEASFSPDLDVLCIDESLRGFEVKGYRSDNRKISKGQLYKGLGQAVTLLNQPISADGGALQYVSLAYPETDEFSGDNWQWKSNFVESLKETPIGLVRVAQDGIETVVEPAENPFYNPNLQETLIRTIRDQATGSDPRHPKWGLRNLAMKIMQSR